MSCVRGIRRLSVRDDEVFVTYLDKPVATGGEIDQATVPVTVLRVTGAFRQHLRLTPRSKAWLLTRNELSHRDIFRPFAPVPYIRTVVEPESPRVAALYLAEGDPGWWVNRVLQRSESLLLSSGLPQPLDGLTVFPEYMVVAVDGHLVEPAALQQAGEWAAALRMVIAGASEQQALPVAEASIEKTMAICRACIGGIRNKPSSCPECGATYHPRCWKIQQQLGCYGWPCWKRREDCHENNRALS